MALPTEILIGIYLGLLTGIIPAVVAWSLGFVFKYFTGVTIPALAVVVLSVAIAGVNGGLLALIDPTITTSPNSPTLIVAIIVVMMMSLYAHSQGDKMGARFPKRLSLRKLRERTLSADVVELVGGRGQVRITPTGDVDDMEGYPPLPADVRESIRGAEWTFPADLPLAELESRLIDRLRTEFDLEDATARIDERGRATIAAAPSSGGLSKRVPTGERAVSIGALVPTGLARGDEVRVEVDGGAVEGTVVSAQSSTASPPEPPTAPDGGTTEAPERPQPAPPTTTGGDGRVTVSVPREDATRLIEADRGAVTVRSRGHRREFELISLLRGAGKRFRKLSVREAGPLDGTTLGEAAVRDTYGVVILAVRRPDGWVLAPRGSTAIEAGDELVVVGGRESLQRFGEGVA